MAKVRKRITRRMKTEALHKAGLVYCSELEVAIDPVRCEKERQKGRACRNCRNYRR